MRENGIPLFSTESFAPAADFDVLGFSLQAELNYSNIVNMLDLAGLPVWQRDRRESRPDRARRRALHRQLRSRSPTSSTRSWSATPRRPCRASSTRTREAARESLPRRDLLARLAAIEGSTSPRFYDVAYHEDGRIAAITRNDPRAPERAKRTWVPVLEARLLPREADGPFRRDRAGPPGPRGHARLHAGLPVLPGGLLVPAGARARSRRRRGHDEEVHRGVRLERGRACCRSRRRTTRRSSRS